VNTQVVEGACAFAWRNYLLLHAGVSENDDRRAALSSYVTSVGEAGDCDFDVLQVAAVAYLKKLDELLQERDARLAADEVLATRFGKISEKKGTNSMTADRTLDTHRVAREQQRRVTAATAIGLNALKPVVQFQVSMLRLWAKSIERFADNYENGREKMASSAVEEHSEHERAA